MNRAGAPRRIPEGAPWSPRDRIGDRFDRVKRAGLARLAGHIHGERHRRSRRLGLSMRLDTDTYIGYVTYVMGVYEPEIVNAIDGVLGTWGRAQFLDVGANIGLMGVSVAARYPQVDVVAFEPIPELADRIEALQSDNGVTFPVLRVAASQVDETVTMFAPNQVNRGFDYGKFNPGMFTTHPGRFHSGRSVEAHGRPIDALVVDGVIDASLPTLVKIDAEGHEPEILRGMRGLLVDRAPRCLIVETLGSTEPERAAGVWTFLTELGYRGWFIGRKYLRGCSSATLDGNYYFERP